MDTLRTPLFVAALICGSLMLLIEVAGAGFITGQAPAGGPESLIPNSGDIREAWDNLDDDEIERLGRQETPPGMAIRYLGFLDGILLFTVGLMALSLVIRERLHARLNGILTVVFSVLMTLACVVAILWAFSQLMVMLSLFLSVPFGTIAYMGLYGFFNRPGALALLSLSMVFKTGFVICLVLAQQRFLQNKGLVLLILTSFLSVVVIGFLHGLVPTFLVSITDAVAAVVVGILAILWAIVLLISSIRPTLRAFRVDRV